MSRELTEKNMIQGKICFMYANVRHRKMSPLLLRINLPQIFMIYDF